jgi:hypothetical protein
MNEFEGGFAGVVRKQLGLPFLGETRDDTRIVTGDICLTGVGLDREVRPFSTHLRTSCPNPVSKSWHRFGNFSERGYVHFLLLMLGNVYIDDMQPLITSNRRSWRGWLAIFPLRPRTRPDKDR